jgi:hypothetical protein
LEFRCHSFSKQAKPLRWLCTLKLFAGGGLLIASFFYLSFAISMETTYLAVFCNLFGSIAVYISYLYALSGYNISFLFYLF